MCEDIIPCFDNKRTPYNSSKAN